MDELTNAIDTIPALRGQRGPHSRHEVLLDGNGWIVVDDMICKSRSILPAHCNMVVS